MTLIKTRARGLKLDDTFVFTGSVSGAESDVVLIKTKTISSSTSSVNFINGTDGVVFDNTYQMYKVIGSDVDVTSSGSNLDCRISTDTGSSYIGSGYKTVGESINYDGGSTSSSIIATVNGMRILDATDSDSDENIWFELWLDNPSNSATMPIFKSNSAHRDNTTTAFAKSTHSGGFYNTAVAYDAFEIRATTGNIDGGVFKLYGYK